MADGDRHGHRSFSGYTVGVATHLALDPFTPWRWPTGPSTTRAPAGRGETPGHRQGSGDPLYGIRRLLVRAGKTLSDRGWVRLEIGLSVGDPRRRVLDAWLAKDACRRISLFSFHTP